MIKGSTVVDGGLFPVDDQVVGCLSEITLQWLGTQTTSAHEVLGSAIGIRTTYTNNTYISFCNGEY